MADLRKDKRAPASLKVKYKSATVDEFIEQFGIDVSSGGIFVKTKKPIETGALLKLELQLNDASPVIHGVGRVCWRREPGPDPTLPAGMGIKFIKLDPDSRAVVERIVQARGLRPSRFDQTEGAEIAPPSIPPEGADRTPPPGPIKRPTTSQPAAAPPARSPAAFAVAPPRPAAAPRAPSPGASAVAGLFADSPLARDSSPEGSPPGGRRSSFFPPPAEDAGSPPPVASSRGLPAPPPAVFGSARPAGARAEHTRQSGEFLAAALAAGGVAEPDSAPATLPPEPSKPAEDELIDQLFADVISSNRQPGAPGAAGAPASGPGSVDDVFAALSEEEGLGSSEPPRPAARAPERAPASRASKPGRSSDPGRSSGPGRARAPSVEPPRPAPFGRVVTPSPAAADSFDAEWDGPTNELEETDFSGPSLRPSALPLPPQEPPASLSLDPGAVSQAPAAARPRSALLWVVPLLLVLAAAGGYFYYQQQLARTRASAEPRALPRSAEGAKPAVDTPPAAGAIAPAGAQPQANAGGAAREVGREPADRERASAGATAAAGERVQVEITSLPRGATVQINNKTIGVSPLHASLPLGRSVQVTVSSEGYATMTKEIVPRAENDPLRFKLEPLPYELRVSTDPAEAELSVGAVTAIAPGPLVLGHLDGSVQVSVGKDGYQRMTRPVRLDEFREEGGVMRAEIEVRLSPLPGGVAPVQQPAPQPSRRRSTSRRRGAAPEAPEPPEVPPDPASAAPPQAPPPPAPAPEADAPPPDLRPEAVAPVKPE